MIVSPNPPNTGARCRGRRGMAIYDICDFLRNKLLCHHLVFYVFMRVLAVSVHVSGEQ